MSLQNFFLFNLDRLSWAGTIVLCAGLLPAPFLLCPSCLPPTFSLGGAASKRVMNPIAFDLPLKSDFHSLSSLDGQSQISFSIDPPRPSGDRAVSRLMIRLSQSKQAQRVEPPARIDLQFGESGALEFSKTPSLFWLELLPIGGVSFEARLMYRDPASDEVKGTNWVVAAQETPVQSAEEFAMGSPFRILSEMQWWGQDVFAEVYGTGEVAQRLESRGIPFNLKEGEWLVFRNHQWEKLSSLAEGAEEPIARIRRVGRELELEGWEGTSHVRLVLGQMPPTTLKTKGEELFTQLRVRSEKQISCTLDKQCLILRPGDWVLKLDQRWKILRKKEEKEAFLSGMINGDIFVLDRIEAKGVGKSISGHYFSASRSQKAAIDYAMAVSRPTRNMGAKGEALLSKGRGKGR